MRGHVRGRRWRVRGGVAGAYVCVGAWLARAWGGGAGVAWAAVCLLWLPGTVWRAVAGGPAEGVACPVCLVWGLEPRAARVSKALGSVPGRLG